MSEPTEADKMLIGLIWTFGASMLAIIPVEYGYSIEEAFLIGFIGVPVVMLFFYGLGGIAYLIESKTKFG